MKLSSKLVLLTLPVLAACGGGGDGKTCTTDLGTLTKSCVTNPSPALPEGLWYGSVNSGQSLAAQTIVLESGQYFSIYTQDGSFLWLIEGIMTATGGAFTDPATVGFHSLGAIRAGTLTGNFTNKTTLTATTSLFVSPDTTATSFNGNYNVTYDTPIALSAVARTWSSGAGVAPISTITFAADGTATGTQSACAFTGSFKPRSTGKHLLDGTLNFAGALCSLNNVSMPVEATVVNGLLTVVGVTSQRDHAFYLSAQ
ncbi:hypothetical protein LMG28727_06693 [Paraburkholderia kirstenboschensis]|uniref:hypothetical protein n=1 Tax=Paraburkholderia kirstenboschensis TaxID=1245436 RepID=UPI000AA6D01D|nr:hypothetical protein [Paraburkholderia kirstenboschensis]CAD6558716.1 hypothetical protein LMG28727_06693 [Paraburkholderia kirstenboschensis]